MKKKKLTWGAEIPPILAIIEHNPTAVLLTTVGYNSAVYKYTIENAEAAPNFPEKILALLYEDFYIGLKP